MTERQMFHKPQEMEQDLAHGWRKQLIHVTTSQPQKTSEPTHLRKEEEGYTLYLKCVTLTRLHLFQWSI